MHQKLPEPKYNMGEVVDLKTPTALIVGIHYRGNPDQMEVRYDVVNGGQIHEGIPEDAIEGINEMETARQAKQFEQQKAAIVAENARREQLRTAKGNPLAAAVGEGLAGVPQQQPVIDDGRERRAGAEDPSFTGPFRRSSDVTDPQLASGAVASEVGQPE